MAPPINPPIHPLTHQTIHPPIGGDIFADFKSSNRIEVCLCGITMTDIFYEFQIYLQLNSDPG